MSASFQDFKAKVASKKTVIGKVTVPTLGEVSLCKMSAADRDRVQRAAIREEESTFYRARIVVGVACDDTGAKLFTVKDEQWLSELDADLLDPIVAESNRLAESVTEKNLKTTTSDALPTA